MLRRVRAVALAAILALVSVGDGWWARPQAAGAQQILALAGDVAPVHDPVAIKEKGTYYVFCTGGRNGEGVIPIRTSTDMRRCSRDSAIGLATTRTLDPSSAAYGWVDDGMVLRSHAETDDWNAIDPNLVIEDRTHAWLVWGSFWSGIKMRRVDPATGKLSTTDTTLHALSSRPREQPINGSVEAPFIVRHDGFWYLFVSFDRCCRGPASTYNIVVGRARDITGPYIDKDGKPMLDGGGSLVLAATTPAWRGPGHPGFLREGRRDYMFFHAYFGEGRGTGSALQISTVAWEHGWPRVGPLP